MRVTRWQLCGSLHWLLDLPDLLLVSFVAICTRTVDCFPVVLCCSILQFFFSMFWNWFSVCFTGVWNKEVWWSLSFSRRRENCRNWINCVECTLFIPFTISCGWWGVWQFCYSVLYIRTFSLELFFFFPPLRFLQQWFRAAGLLIVFFSCIYLTSYYKLCIKIKSLLHVLFD